MAAYSANAPMMFRIFTVMFKLTNFFDSCRVYALGQPCVSHDFSGYFGGYICCSSGTSVWPRLCSGIFLRRTVCWHTALHAPSEQFSDDPRLQTSVVVGPAAD
jgi:hypothetical protein